MAEAFEDVNVDKANIRIGEDRKNLKTKKKSRCWNDESAVRFFSSQPESELESLELVAQLDIYTVNRSKLYSTQHVWLLPENVWNDLMSS